MKTVGTQSAIGSFVCSILSLAGFVFMISFYSDSPHMFAIVLGVWAFGLIALICGWFSLDWMKKSAPQQWRFIARLGIILSSLALVVSLAWVFWLIEIFR
jgi:hypothetical protein